MKVLPLQTAADADRVQPAVRAHLAAGGIIAYPTETVYGLGTALDPLALARLAAAKGRAEGKPFLLLAAEPTQLPGLAWTPSARLLAQRFWPGPLTIALAADERYPPAVRSAAGTVAVRDTALQSLRTLLRRLRHPITSTSANLPDEPPANSLPELLQILALLPGTAAMLVLDGGSLPASLPSTVVDCSAEPPRLLREGAVSLAQLRTVLEQQRFVIDVE